MVSYPLVIFAVASSCFCVCSALFFVCWLACLRLGFAVLPRLALNLRSSCLGLKGGSDVHSILLQLCGLLVSVSKPPAWFEVILRLCLDCWSSCLPVVPFLFVRKHFLPIVSFSLIENHVLSCSRKSVSCLSQVPLLFQIYQLPFPVFYPWLIWYNLYFIFHMIFFPFGSLFFWRCDLCKIFSLHLPTSLFFFFS